MTADFELVQRLRDIASGIEAGNVTDPHGHRVGALRQAADALEARVGGKMNDLREAIAWAVYGSTEIRRWVDASPEEISDAFDRADAALAVIAARGYKMLSREPTDAMVQALAQPHMQSGTYLTAESAIQRYVKCWDAAP